MQAKDVVWRTVQYDDQKQDLLVSDLDRLRAKEKERLQEPIKGESWDVDGESFPSDISDFETQLRNNFWYLK